DFVAEGIKKFRYVYDFGDNWLHFVQVEKVLNAEPKVKYPRCIDGRRACPQRTAVVPTATTTWWNPPKNPARTRNCWNGWARNSTLRNSTHRPSTRIWRRCVKVERKLSHRVPGRWTVPPVCVAVAA